MLQDDPLIKKEILYPGTKCVEFKPGTKVKFHFVTKKSNGTVLDDSRKDGVGVQGLVQDFVGCNDLVEGYNFFDKNPIVDEFVFRK